MSDQSIDPESVRDVEAEDVLKGEPTTLIYPGQADWTWLISPRHRGYIPTRNAEMSIWDIHENPRRMAALLLGKEVGEDPRK